MRCRSLPVLALVALLAGCAAPAASPSSDPAAAPAPRVELTGCADFTGRFPVPMGEARAAVPEPLAPRAYRDADELGAQWVIAARCATMRGAGVDASESPFALRTYVVDAPDAWVPEGVGFLVAVHAAHAADAGFARWLEAAGAGDVSPGASFEVTDGAVRVGKAELGAATFVVTGATQEARQDADFVRLFLVRDGVVAGAIDWHVTQSRVRAGTATLSDAATGLGGHFWADDYDHNMTAVTLPPV